MTRRLTIEEVKHYIESNSDCLLISKEYINAHEKIELTCSCGKNFKTTYAILKKMKTICCVECTRKEINRKNTNNQEEVLKRIEEKIGERFEILPFEYIGKQKTNIKLICKKCGKEISRMYHSINTREIKCDCECKLIKWDKERAIKLVKKYTDEFEVLECNRGDSIILKHKNCGHEFVRAYWNIEQNQCLKCPICDSRESMGVKLITKFLESNNMKYVKEYRFPDCKDIKTLPFDFYLPQYNMIIEYDGIQHFKPTDYMGGVKSYEILKKHDEMKNEYCRENNIPLIRISYKDNENINNILANIFKIS